jgi:hypothetical protein
MTDTTPRVGAPLLAAAQAQKHVTHNEALYQFDAFLCARFLDRTLSAPPGSPADGDTYLVATGGSGLWTGQDGAIAYCADGDWRFYPPFGGLVAYVANESKLIVYTGSAWVDYSSLIALEDVPMLGVNTTADSTNKLAVQSNAILFTDQPTGSGGTGDVRATLSKQASTNTASFLFQDAFSGRAEVGLAGDDNFHFKVSPDGATWHDAIVLTNSSGLATIASAAIGGGTVNGASVGATTPASGAFTTLSVSAAATLSPASANVTLSPTGTGSVTIAPATAGAMNNVVLGATTPQAATFTSFASNAFKDNKTTASTTVLTDTQGRLLVGPTGSFSTALAVAGSTAGFQIASTNSSANLNTVRFTASAASGGTLSLAHSRATTIGSFATLSPGDQLGVVDFAGDDGASYNTIGAQIRGLALSSGTISTGVIPGQIVLAVMNAGGTLTDLLKLDATGGLQSLGAVALSPANASVVLSPTGTGTVTLNPATAGTIDNVALGATTPATGKFTTLGASTQLNTPKVSSNATSALDLQTSGGTQFEIAHTASAVNFLQATGSAAGAGIATLAAAGTDSNIDITLTPKGSGAVRLGTVANGAVATALSSVGPTGAHATVQEWFAVKNASGTIRYIPAF